MRRLSNSLKPRVMGWLFLSTIACSTLQISVEATATPVVTPTVVAVLPPPEVALEIPDVHTLTNTIWSPNGNWLAVSTPAGVDLYNIQTFTRANSLVSPIGEFEWRAMAFSPDGDWLATLGHDSVIQRWDVSTGHLHQTLSSPNVNVTSLFFSLDSGLLMTRSLDGLLRLRVLK